MIPCLHVAATVAGKGGMGSVLRALQGLAADDEFVGLFDRRAETADRGALALGGRGWTTPGQLRSRAAAATARFSGRLVVYHNLWGVRWFADRDGAVRRMGYVHTDRPDFADWVRAQSGLLDGLIAPTHALEEAALALLPELRERTITLRYPVANFSRPRVPRRPGDPWRLGFAGRLERKQKRVDRLPELARELDRRQVNWTLEILGSGAAERGLRRALAGDSRVTFCGWQEGAEYWRRLATWDQIVFCSDYEGSPLALVEAMHAGVLPLFPALGRTDGDSYAPQVDARCLYPAGQLAEAAAQVAALATRPEPALAPARERARVVAQVHSPEHYSEAWSAFVAKIAALPPLAREPRRGWRPADWLPIGLLGRTMPRALLR